MSTITKLIGKIKQLSMGTTSKTRHSRVSKKQSGAPPVMISKRHTKLACEKNASDAG